MASSSEGHSQGEMLSLRKIASLTGELIDWRSNNEVRQADREGGGIFDFIKGLRLAARLIYILKNKLADYGLDTNWGQILSDDGVYLSPECDIIIHKGGQVDKWNGEGGKHGNVMDFRFIKLKKVVAVISCKSYLTSFKPTDENYCKRLKPYMKGKKLWLFAECVPKGKEKEIERKAKKIGHNGMWFLYSWDEVNMQSEENRPLWNKFLLAIEKLGG